MTRRAEVGIYIRAKEFASGVFARVKGSAASLKSTIFSLQTAMFALGGAAIIRVGSTLVKMYGRQEHAVIRLNSALANTNRFTEENSRLLIENAAALQKVTTHGDEAIIEATATIAELAGTLTGPQLMDAQKAVIGLADTFFQGNIGTAATMLAKSIGSSVNALSRYGVELDTSGTEQDKLNQILAMSIPLFNTSKAAATDVLGAFEQLGNAIGDTKEEFGEIIVKVLDLDTATLGLTGSVTGFNERIADNRSEWIKWGRLVWTILKAVGKTFGSLFSLAWNSGRTIGAALDVVVQRTVRAIVEIVNVAIGSLNWLIEKANTLLPDKWDIGEIKPLDTTALDAGVNAAQGRFEEYGGLVIAGLQGVGDAWIDVGEAALAAAEDVATAAERIYTNVPEKPDAGKILPPPEPPRPLSPEEIERRERLVQIQDDIRREQDESLAAEIPEDVEVNLTVWDEMSRKLLEMYDAGEGLGQLFADMTTGVIQDFGNAVMDAFGAMTDGSKTAGQAFASAMLGALAAVASGFGRFFLANATGELAKAIANPLAAGLHLAAAAKYTAAAAGMFALAGAARAGASGGGGGGGGTAGIQSATDDLGGDRGSVDLYIEGGILDVSDPRQQEAFANMLSTISGLRVNVRGAPG